MEIIRELHTEHQINYDGKHFQVDSAREWDLPDQPVELVATPDEPRWSPSVRWLSWTR